MKQGQMPLFFVDKVFFMCKNSFRSDERMIILTIMNKKGVRKHE